MSWICCVPDALFWAETANEGLAVWAISFVRGWMTVVSGVACVGRSAITVTLFPSFATYAVLVMRFTAVVYGPNPVGTVTVEFVAPSITVTVELSRFVT